MSLFRHKPSSEQWPWLIALALAVIAEWVAALMLAPRGKVLAPLHYTIYFGIDLSGGWRSWLWLPALGTIITTSHIFFSRRRKDLIWRRSWLVLALVLDVLLLTSLGALTYIVSRGL